MNILEEKAFPFLLTFKIILCLIPVFFITGLVFSYLCMGKNKYVNEIIDTICTLPMVFPPIVTGFFIIYILGKNGILGRFFDSDKGLNLIFSFKGLLLAGYLSGIPFIIRSVKSGFKKDIKNLCKTSYTLGKNRLQTFIFVVVPAIKLNILSGMILSTGRVIGEVGVTLMVGGNISGKTNTVSLEIYNCVLDGNFEKAVFISGILAVFSICIFSFFKFVNYLSGIK